jgi:hypothetical protein
MQRIRDRLDIGVEVGVEAVEMEAISLWSK